MSSRGWGKGKETYSHASDAKVHLDASMRVPEEMLVLKELTEIQTPEKEKQETLFEVMSHAPARDREKSRGNETRLIERTAGSQQERRSVTSLKVRMMQEAIGSPKSQNPPPMKRTCPSPGYVRRPIHSLHGSVTSNSPRGSACQPMSKHMTGPKIQKTTLKYSKPQPRWNIGKC
ncbi:hypothetical protein Tco_0070888 [Tanacetum coccineum]